MSLSDIDLSNPDNFVADVPNHWFARLRREDPVFWNPETDGGGFWAITKHEDLAFVSRSPELFSSAAKATNIPDPPDHELDWLRRIMLNMDPPEHRRFRSIVKGAFTPRAVKLLHDTVADMARDIVDRVAARGQCEFVDEVAAQMPMQVICEMVGVPHEIRRAVYDCTNRLVGFDDPELKDADADPMQDAIEMVQYAAQTAEYTRANPGDNLATMLLIEQVDGGQLDDLEFNMFFLMLAVAGNETTRTVTTHGLRLLMEHPEALAKIRERPALLDNAIREMLRYSPAVHHFRRTATRDVELRGKTIRAGDKVTIWYPSANRDEEVYDDADVFDIERDASSQLAFGIGEHFCLGAHLAHLELKAILSECIARLGNPRLDGPVRRLRSNFINGVKEMPIRFDPI
jgi:cholest-4-en-3-one 26-monooxygenase